MKTWKFSLAIAGCGLLLLCFSSPALARVHVGFSIGTSVGRCYPYAHYGYHPYRSWWDRGWYRPYPGHYYWPRHSGLGIWIHDHCPVVIDAPVVVRRHAIGSARDKTAVSAEVAALRAQRRKAIERKKSEQIKILKVGDKQKRIQAIHELAPYSSDNGIRETLATLLRSDPDSEVRKEVAVAFGRTENPLVLAALTEAKENDPVREVRQAAYRAMIMIKGY